MDLQQADKVRRAAHAAWVTAGAPEKGATQAALAEASRAYAAAKKALAPVAEASASPCLEAIQAGRAERQARAQAEARALAAIRRAHEWPRCGQGYPATAAEEAALQWAIKAHGSLDAAAKRAKLAEL